jgi:hypothetical protein
MSLDGGEAAAEVRRGVVEMFGGGYAPRRRRSGVPGRFGLGGCRAGNR